MSSSPTKALFGIVFHAVLATLGAFTVGLAFMFGIEALFHVTKGVQLLAEFLPFVITSAFLSAFATPRWFSRSAPWVGLLGLAALFLGGQELARGWSPTWSHQTRSDYVLSQLFGVGSGCGDSECLYALLFGLPFICLTTYSLAALITLRLIRR